MKNMNKVISSILISSMLLTPVSTFALTKEEKIYANLNYDGKVEKTTVNNHLFNLEKGTITDDTELFLKLVQLREDGGDSGEENHNPDTADINLALILAIVLGSATGCVVLSKQLKARA